MLEKPIGYQIVRLGWSVLAVLLLAALPALANEPVLTCVRDLLDLSADEAAEGREVHVRGVVTYTEQSWIGQFFIQDETGGAFVGQSSKGAPKPGEIVDVRGFSHPGAYAPFINKPQWDLIGSGPLPEAPEISMERFASGIDDGLRVRVGGRVRRVFADKPDHWTLIMSTGGQRFEVVVRKDAPDRPSPDSWVGSMVKVTGVLAAEYQLHRRGLAMVRVFVASPAEVVVERAEEIDPYQHDLIPLSRIGQYRRDLAPGQRSRVRGVVVAQFGSESLAIEDPSGGLLIKGRDLGGFLPGDTVEAVGFEDLENFLPVLQDCSVVKLDVPRHLPAPNHPTVEEMIRGKAHGCLVKVDAELVEIGARPGPDDAAKGREIIMTLQRDGNIFKADYADQGAEKDDLPFVPGSRVSLTGICLAEANRDGRVVSFRLRLTDGKSVAVTRPPPWLNSRRLQIALLSALAGMVLFGAWILMSSRKNRQLRSEIREREKLTAELEQAKQKLSLRVDERTEELKLQISERKESEVRFKAVIGERTRLAQELHDGLQQGLTGVALQLDTASRLRERAPEQSIHHLELARTLMRQTHADLRSSVWNLRSRSQEDFSLIEALRQSGGRFTEGTDLSVEVIQTGEPLPLSELEEENLLRIGQEALTNAIKHSKSDRVEIHLDFSPGRLVMRIRDFGAGFSPDRVHGPAEGHFGLSGMSERAQRIGGTLEIHSTPGSGTLIEATLPIGRGARVAENSLETPSHD